MTSRRLLTAGIVLIILAGLLSACSKDPRQQTTTIGAGGGTVTLKGAGAVVFPAGALDASHKVTVTMVDTPEFDTGTAITPMIDVDLGGGALRKPVTVRLKLDRDWDQGGEAAIMMASQIVVPGATVWSSNGGTIDARRGVLTAQVGHFSKVGGRKIVARDLVQSWSKIVSTLAAIQDDLNYQANPKCAPVSQLWSSEALSPELIKTCASSVAATGAGQVNITNNRIYPQVMRLKSFPGRYRLTPGAFATSPQSAQQKQTNDLAEQFFIWLGKEHPERSYLPAKGTVFLDLDPAAAGKISFTTEPDWLALTVEFIVKALASVPLFRTQLEGARGAAEVFSGMWDLGNCFVKGFQALGASSLGKLKPGGLTGLIAECLSSGRLIENSAQGVGNIADISDVITAGLDDVSTLIRVAKLIKDTARGGTDQTVTVRRKEFDVSRQLGDGKALPVPVQDTLRKLRARAQKYEPGGGPQFDDLTGSDGLQYSGAADPGQAQSIRLGEGADPIAGPLAAAALTDLTEMPPRLTVCPETQNAAYVIGADPPSAPGYARSLANAGFSAEESAIVIAHATAAVPYRICIRSDGTWTSFSKRAAIGFDFAALRSAETTDQDGQGVCRAVASSPFVPSDAYCPQVVAADLDGDGHSDRLLLYTRAELYETQELVARAVLASGYISDLVVPTSRGSVDQPTIMAHLDLNASGGEEVVVKVEIVGADPNLPGATVLTMDGKNLVLTQMDSGPSYVNLWEDGSFWAKLSCGDSGTITEDVTSIASADGTEWERERTVWRLDGSRFVQQSKETTTAPRPDDADWGIDCGVAAGGTASVPVDGSYTAEISRVDADKRQVRIRQVEYLEGADAQAACEADGRVVGVQEYCTAFYIDSIRPTLQRLPIERTSVIQTYPINGEGDYKLTRTSVSGLAERTEFGSILATVVVKNGHVISLKEIYQA